MAANPPSDPAPYIAAPEIESLADIIGDPVTPATFPRTILRWRNDRAAAEVGLARLTDADWIDHFARFRPLPANLSQPLALRYHGHQFGTYNSDLGDGRGFLFGQLRDQGGRLLDLGTKGSGQTPYSRFGDGRLTLKGGVREILATEMLEALGVPTSRTFSLIETGESLHRGDEPSPTRAAVLVRLSHGHIRIGSFQRLAALGDADAMTRLTAWCLRHYFGGDDGDASGDAAARLFIATCTAVAETTGRMMAAGFVHGVLNSDNVNVTGEAFDYGPWRFLPRWDRDFVAAYFDHAGRYAFGRQPAAMHWNLGQFAVALRLITDAPPLIAALETFPARHDAAFTRHMLWRLGLASAGDGQDRATVAAAEAALTQGTMPPDLFFAAGARVPGDGAFAAFRAAASRHRPLRDPPTMDTPSLTIDIVEQLWSAIAERDDWTPLIATIDAIRAWGRHLGPTPPLPQSGTGR